jgi:uncharacterized secreted repeat protein (TIGR03808 family)
MTVDRRHLLSAGLAAGVGASAAGIRSTSAQAQAAGSTDLGLVPGSNVDQSSVLQLAVDEAASSGSTLSLPAGRFRVGAIKLRSGTRLIGANGATELEFTGSGGSFLTGQEIENVVIEGLTLVGAYKGLVPDAADGLITLNDVKDARLRNLRITQSAASGISLIKCSGSVTDCRVTEVMDAAIRSIDARGMEIAHNDIADCGNNGIQVWRYSVGEDGTIVTANRIARVRADGGGSGQNGNGINVYRAGGVLVSDNRITDCAFSAVRGNSAANIQILANNCARLGEVALYSEFGFQGAVIANNVVDTAATGISVTNFNEGGRLAVVQGNLIRNMFRREQEPVDVRGHGISVEADTVLSNNVIEKAPTAGIIIGWGSYMREVVASGNLVRDARVGILVTANPGAGACLLSGNMISGSTDGAIRGMDDNGEPTGPELVSGAGAGGNISVAGNLAV